MFNTEEVMETIRRNIKEGKENTSPLIRISNYHEKVIKLCREEKGLILFGAGSYGVKILLDLINNGIDCIYCFCDNKRAGDVVHDIPVYSLEECKTKYPGAGYVITPKGCENEILRQLINADVLINHIIVFNYSEAGLGRS